MVGIIFAFIFIELPLLCLYTVITAWFCTRQTLNKITIITNATIFKAR